MISYEDMYVYLETSSFIFVGFYWYIYIDMAVQNCARWIELRIMVTRDTWSIKQKLECQ